ncbi:MAG TPA: winged helix-turn-helix domain-containing protein [Gemmatimonadaceae bacterium]
MIRFGDFSFDPATGELTRGGKTERLAPQTAQVLRLLIEQSGHVVSRADFRREIWPDTTVEFDQGLNFCIRQLRIALEDDAANPTFIETLPRRGYRFRVPITREVVGDSRVVLEPATQPVAIRRRGLRSVGALVLGVVALGGILAWASHRLQAGQQVLAIVPFDADSSITGLATYRDGLAESLVERTTNQTIGVFTVVGPSMTSRFGSRTPIDTIHTGIGAAYALSGVVRRRSDAFEVFAQLVRASDRAHVWVIRLQDSSTAGGDYAAIAARVADSVSAILLHPEVKRVPRGFESTTRR